MFPDRRGLRSRSPRRQPSSSRAASSRPRRLPSVLLALAAGAPASLAEAKDVKRIAVMADGPADAHRALLKLAQKELSSFGYEVDGLFPEDKARVGDFTLATALLQLDALDADPAVEVIWAFGPIASTAAVRRALDGRLSKAVVAPFVLSATSQLLREKRGAARQLSHLIFDSTLREDLEALKGIGPMRRVAFLIPSFIREVLPEVEGILGAEAARSGVELLFVSEPDVESLLRALPADIDALYVGFDPRRSESDLEALARGLIARNLPSFSQVGRVEVERGLMMGLGSTENALRLARAVAVNTDAILRGEAPEHLSYALQRVERLVVHAGTAKALGRSLSWALLSEAELVGLAEPEDARKLSLLGVVKEVEALNLVLRANREELEAREQSVREARGALLPRLDFGFNGALNDPDAANPLNPERSLTWSGNASQVIVNEPALAQLSVQEHLRDATRFDNRTATLEVVQSAAISYLSVLRALVGERVQRENLRVTKTQLSLAQIRQQVGSGSRSEQVRLESQLANNRSSVIDAIASRNVAEIDLRRLLNRGSEDPMVLEDVSLETSPLMKSGQRLHVYLEGPAGFEVLRQFMALEALRNAPELQASAARLAAQERLVLSNQLSLFLPFVSVTAGVTSVIATGGAGTSPEEQAIFAIDPLAWRLGFAASWRIWEGNARYARIRREQAIARGQDLDLQARRVEVEAKLRSALHRAAASYAGIRLQRLAAEAAAENLRLVSEGFGRGKENVITLVDAQSQALTAQLGANTAAYEYMIDLLQVQRAMGRFALIQTEEEVEDFFRRLRAFAANEEDPQWVKHR